jgi:replicative DNA helicase
MPPHSIDAEQALLGAVMVNNKLYDRLEGALLADHFYVPLHAAVFDAMDSLIGRQGREANPISVRERLRGTPFDGDNHLFPHLSTMFERAGQSSDVQTLAEVIINAYRQRKLMGLGDSLKAQASAAVGSPEVKQVIESAEGVLFELDAEAGGKKEVRGLRHHIIAVIKGAEAAKKLGTGMTGVSSGLADLDRLLGGLQRSDLIILGARPSMGKTSLIINIAQAAAERKKNGEANGAAVGVFSLEMSAEQLTQRILSSAAGIPANRISNGQFGEGEFQRMAAAVNELADLPLYIDDTPGLSINAMRSRARRMKRQFNIGLLVVDYLQLMTAPLKGDQNRVQEISAISQGLKQIARELDIPVIAASQLSRQLENRDNKRPQLSDLRESGSIEQDADLVWFLYREEYYLSKQLGAADETMAANDKERQALAEAKDRLDRVRGITELLVSKNRKGPTDTIRLLFKGETTTFMDYSPRSLAQ